MEKPLKNLIVASAAFSFVFPSAVAVAAPLSLFTKDTVAQEFDITGVKLGMSPEEVEIRLKAAVFKTARSEPALDPDSWQTAIDREIAKRRPSHIFKVTKIPTFSMAWGPRGERIEAWYARTPDGPRVSSVSMSIPTEQMTREMFVKGVLAKYGEPTSRDFGRKFLYCSAGEQVCRIEHNRRKAELTADTSYSFHKLTLSIGQEEKESLLARFSREVEALVPRDAKPVF